MNHYNYYENLAGKITYILLPSEILDSPKDMVVFLMQQADFTCETDHGFPSWRINGTLLHEVSPELRSNLTVDEINTPMGTTVERLIIPAREEYNGTNIKCLVVSSDGGSLVESENVTLKIQGN